MLVLISIHWWIIKLSIVSAAYSYSYSDPSSSLFDKHSKCTCHYFVSRPFHPFSSWWTFVQRISMKIIPTINFKQHQQPISSLEQRSMFKAVLRWTIFSLLMIFVFGTMFDLHCWTWSIELWLWMKLLLPSLELFLLLTPNFPFYNRMKSIEDERDQKYPSLFKPPVIVNNDEMQKFKRTR